MACLINCDKCGDYCCDNSSFTVNNDPLIMRAANFPLSDILVQVDKEFVPSGQQIGGDITCVVIRKPGCYRVDFDCDDYVGPAPSPGATELCYSCEPGYDVFTELVDKMSSGYSL